MARSPVTYPNQRCQTEVTKLVQSSDMIDIAAVFRIGIDEQFVNRHRSSGEPLLMAITNDGFEVLSIAFAQPVDPGIGPKDFSLFFKSGPDPGEGSYSRIGDPPVGDGLGLIESFHQADRRPGVFVDDLLLDGCGVHDRKYSRALVIVYL